MEREEREGGVKMQQGDRTSVKMGREREKKGEEEEEIKQREDE